MDHMINADESYRQYKIDRIRESSGFPHAFHYLSRSVESLFFWLIALSCLTSCCPEIPKHSVFLFS